MHSRPLFATLLLGTVSVGCDHPDKPTLEYFCEDLQRLTVTYFKAPEPGLARVVVGDVTYELPHIITPTGARFSDGKVTWWEHGGEAELTRGEASTECVELPE
jgi:membrane-bound inhibitor of C-type lysozyme